MEMLYSLWPKKKKKKGRMLFAIVAQKEIHG